MSKRNLLSLGLLSLALITVGGCAQKMAKGDAAAPPANSTAQAQPENTAAAPAATQETPAAAPAAESTAAAAPADAAKAPEPAAATAALPSPLPAASASSSAAPAKPVDAAEAQQVAAALLPLPSQEIMDTIKKMTNHRMTRYLSRSAQYDFYVGGRLDALYDINKNQFTIKDENSSNPEAVTCEYSKNGELISNGKDVPPKVIGVCNTLVNELNTYLSR